MNKKEEKIILFKAKRDCSGCSACMNICPVTAIKMEKDKYGFIYPKIDEKKCIRCGLCKKVCSYQNDELKYTNVSNYAAMSSDEEILKQSASGGIFSTLANNFIKDNGIVYGCSMEYENNVLTPRHIRIDNENDIQKLQGSKYVNSIIDYIYQNVKNDLKNSKKVLFSGTPCQIAALNSYLNISRVNTKNLYTIDIICHGTPSTQFFQDYIRYYESKNNVKITAYKFRDKTRHWGLKGTAIYKDTGNNIKQKDIYGRLSTYYKMFLYGEIYRENCYSCKYAGKNRVGDITIGDYWGIEKVHPEYVIRNNGIFETKKGVSCIIVNSQNGEKLIKKYGENIMLEKTYFDLVAKNNGQLNKPVVMPKSRSTILKIYENDGYAGVDKYIKKKQGLKRPLYYIYYKLNLKKFMKK